MELLDWLVLIGTTLFITLYGIRERQVNTSMESYLKADNTLPWYTISLSVIATQASAITFLSAPGQAYVDGMRFVLFYLGLPLAMIFICIVIIPAFYRLNVITAYEFLESRFDLKTRLLTAFFFLVQRGLAAGISIAAPSIVLSVILGWNIYWVNLLVGGIVIFYTVTGGSQAVSQTQKLQMITILSGMAIAGYLVVAGLPAQVSFSDAMWIAGKTDKLNTMDFTFDLDNRYNFWSGIIGGFFLQLAYFGTDQSQVGRYLGGSHVSQSRLGLLFNGIFKIPMQFSILFIGAMLFVFYQFEQPPLFFNEPEIAKIKQSEYAAQYQGLEQEHEQIFKEKKQLAFNLIQAIRGKNEQSILTAETAFKNKEKEFKQVKENAIALLKKYDVKANTNDANYIFLTFVTQYLPAGLVGLLITVILAASMSTTSSELNALASTTMVDFYKRIIYPNGHKAHYLWMSQLMTVVWGAVALVFAQLASQLGTLIEAVNILGSLFYGTILGIFLLAFFFKSVNGKAAFWGAICGEIVVILIYFKLFGFTVAYLWLNMIGCVVVIVCGLLLGLVFRALARSV
ncbi:MAG: sodium:solute symporter [Microscillaceae bacterium]|nr:sodium:solute symporter [Microscillaceae bacterium]